MSKRSLKSLWDENLEFQRAVVTRFDSLTEEEKIKLTKEYLLHIVSEMNEFLKATGKWKTVLQEERKPSIPGLTEEIIDEFKFLVNIALIWRISPENFVDEFWRKSDVNWQKFRQETLPIGENEKIAVFDLDGVLALYPEYWARFLNKRISIKQQIDITNIKNIHNIAPKVNRKEYSRLKAIYRERGSNLGIPMIEGASRVTHKLRTMDYKIVILTRRPVHKHKRIYADTISWLKTNSIAFDGIYWSEDGEKDNFLKETLNNIEFVIEDDPVQINRLLKAGFKVFYLMRLYNKNIPLDSGAIKLETLDDLFTFIPYIGGD